jgi:hypothetical protein
VAWVARAGWLLHQRKSDKAMTAKTMDIEKATESTFAKFSARLLTPVLLMVLGYLGNRQLNSIEETQKNQSTKQEATSDKVNIISSDVRDLSTRIDYSVVREVNDLRTRVEQLEKVTRTP